MIEQIKMAREKLRGVCRETALMHSAFFSKEYGLDVYLKPENLQETGAFKLRGAYFKIAQLSEEERSRGLIASSAGNHAQGVAFAAKSLGVSATIVMPRNTPLIKIEATRKLGAEVILHGDIYDEANSEARRIEAERGSVFIHPFDDKDIIAGQGTIGLEILEELPDVEAILVPVGGGGLIAGVASAVKAIKPEVMIIGVEPEGARTMSWSIQSNEIRSLDRVDTIADGVAVRTPGSITFDICRNLVDEWIAVPDDKLMQAFLLLVERHKLVAENSGVLPLAALDMLNIRGKKVVPIISGGNIDVVTIASMIDRGLVSRGRIFCFAADLPDEPGQLLKISTILAKQQANIIKLEHNQFKALNRLRDVQLEVTVETNGHEHIKHITHALQRAGFMVSRVY